ncbi:MAG: type II secretion system protein GspJ [Gammaproteobacteria bacterium]|nr:type II secretion system protein GspJ [Gammaproteobacteria bacterium]
MKQHGFTLVELLIAIAILSVISLISYNALDSTLKHQSIQKQHTQNLMRLQKTLLYFERDFSQTLHRKITLGTKSIRLSSVQNDTLLDIQYQFSGNTVKREEISNLDKKAELILLEKVKEFKIRLLDNTNKWHTTWKHKNNKNYLKAIEIKFTHPYWGDIKKIVAIQ